MGQLSWQRCSSNLEEQVGQVRDASAGLLAGTPGTHEVPDLVEGTSWRTLR